MFWILAIEYSDYIKPFSVDNPFIRITIIDDHNSPMSKTK
jgi:hypothetical protein